MYLSNSVITIVYLCLTALAHTTNNGAVKALVHAVRRVSLYAGGLVITLIMVKHGLGSLAYCYNQLAVYGLFGAWLVVILNDYVSRSFQSVPWIVTLNVMVLISLLLIKSQSIATGRPWAPEDFSSAWFWYSVFYLVAISSVRLFNMRPFQSPEFLSAFDRLIQYSILTQKKEQ